MVWFLSFSGLIQGLEEGRPQILGVFPCTRVKTRGSESCSVLNVGFEQKKNLYPQFIDLFICGHKSVMKKTPNTTLQARVFSCQKTPTTTLQMRGFSCQRKEERGLFCSGLCHSVTDDSDLGGKVHPFSQRPEFTNKLPLCENRVTVFSLVSAQFHLTRMFGCNARFESLQRKIPVVAVLPVCHAQGCVTLRDVSMENLENLPKQWHYAGHLDYLINSKIS